MENLEKYGNSNISEDFELTELFGDVIMVAYTDCNGEGYVKRGTLWIDPATTYNMWRVGEVLMKGPKVSEQVNIGDLVQFPNDRGIPGIKFKDKTVHYINEDRLFGKVKLKEEYKDGVTV